MNKKVLMFSLGFIGLVIIVTSILLINNNSLFNNKETSAITSYDECVEAGNPTIKTYPGKCITDDGQVFIDEVNLDNSNNSDNLDYFPEDLKACNVSEDCVPKPGCHPKECINKKYESSFEKPEMCTMQYDYSAAYSAEDCICQNLVCVNKNLENGNIE